MELIAHRINSVAQLQELPEEYGVELDLRDSFEGSLHIEHNPFAKGESFEEYLKHYHHGTMVLNIKSERIEHKVKDLLVLYGIEKYFFLDSSFPMIKLLTDMGENNVAVRFSEYEGLDTVKAMAGRASWVWVDCFNRIPLDRTIFEEIKSMGYQLCFVSPELQGQPEKLDFYIQYIQSQELVFDAVCTKTYHIDRWKSVN